MKKKPAGALAFLMFILCVSVLLRVPVGTGQAFAQATADIAPPDKKPEVAAAAPAMEQCESYETPEDFQALLSALQNKEQRLDQREAEITARMAALTEADKKIADRLAKLQSAEDRLRETLAIAETAAEQDVSKLVTVYEAMKPKEAAALFSQMDPNFAAGFLARMVPERAAGVLAGMKPEEAYMISVILAGRNANAPRE